MRRKVDKVIDPRLTGPPNTPVEMKIIIRRYGRDVAVSTVWSNEARLPPGWLAQPRETRDADLDWWWNEAANAWLQNCWEDFPPSSEPEPEQGSLL